MAEEYTFTKVGEENYNKKIAEMKDPIYYRIGKVLEKPPVLIGWGLALGIFLGYMFWGTKR